MRDAKNRLCTRVLSLCRDQAKGVSAVTAVAELVLRTSTVASPHNSDTDVVGTRLNSVQHI